MLELAKDFYRYLKHHKKWWLIPLLILMFAFSGLVIYAQGSAIAPFVYTFF